VRNPTTTTLSSGGQNISPQLNLRDCDRPMIKLLLLGGASFANAVIVIRVNQEVLEHSINEQDIGDVSPLCVATQRMSPANSATHATVRGYAGGGALAARVPRPAEAAIAAF
jgi:hypothetical protein